MKILDRYIIKKFLTTFCFVVALLLMIAFIIDLTEKIDNFLSHDELNFKAVAFNYYIYFFPWIGLMLAPFFVFISAIYFNSKLTENSEIIAIFNGKVSYLRLLMPYLFCSILLGLLFRKFNHDWLPKTNKQLFAFTDKYTSNSVKRYDQNVHIQFNKDTFVYVQNWDDENLQGMKFTMEVLKDKILYYKLSASLIKYDTLSKKWNMDNWQERTLSGKHYTIKEGSHDIRRFTFAPQNFLPQLSTKETMTTAQLSRFINDLRHKGSENLDFYIVEKYRRDAVPFSTIILTIIAFAITIRKRRSGMGIYLVVGLALCGIFVFIQQFSAVFATKGSLSPFWGAWLPNIIFGILSLILLYNSRK